MLSTQDAWVYVWLATFGFVGWGVYHIDHIKPKCRGTLVPLLDQLWIGSKWPRLVMRTAVPGLHVDKRSSYWSQRAVLQHSGTVSLGWWFLGSAITFASFSVDVWLDQPEFGEIQRFVCSQIRLFNGAVSPGKGSRLELNAWQAKHLAHLDLIWYDWMKFYWVRGICWG